MESLKKLLHGLAVRIGKLVAAFLPDRVPVTFVGSDAVAELCESIAHSGVAKLLLVTDETLVRLGLVERVGASLDAAGLRWSVYAGVLPDPTFDQIAAGYDQLESDGCDAVLALGGGSPMDAAKMIAALGANGRPLSKLEGRFKVRLAPLPLFAIPTTAGTGSEVTIAAVVSDSTSHEKKFFLDPKLLPLMAALDPTLMSGLPPAVTAATGMDALTHAVESFIAKTSTAQTERYARLAIRLVFEHLPVAYRDGSDLAARKAMALASYYAGLAFTRTSVGYVHAIAHTFGAHYGTPHGLANAIALPHVLEFSKSEARGRLALLADLVGVGCGATSDADKADRFIEAIRELMGEVGIASHLDSIEREDIGAIARQACAEAFLNYPVPKYMTEHECAELVGRIAPPQPQPQPESQPSPWTSAGAIGRPG